MRPLSFLLAAVLATAGCGKAASEKLVVFHAGSLSEPLARMEAEFERLDGTEVLREASGSRLAAKKVSDLGRRADLVISADYSVIETILMPKHARWLVKFAANRMVLAYTAGSRAADRVSADNWFEILLEPETRWGYSDPNVDPCGYRAVLVMKLAERFYKKRGLGERLLQACPKERIRPKSVELTSLLESGDLDYAWEYRSVAVQHGLRFVELPPELSLGDPSMSDFYRSAEVRLKDGAGKTGEPIIYGATIPENAPNRAAALRFLAFLLSDRGGKILEALGQPRLTPELVGDAPEDVRRVVAAAAKR